MAYNFNIYKGFVRTHINTSYTTKSKTNIYIHNFSIHPQKAWNNNHLPRVKVRSFSDILKRSLILFLATILAEIFDSMRINKYFEGYGRGPVPIISFKKK